MWSKSVVEWTHGNTAYLSVVFSWQLQQAFERAVWLRCAGYDVMAGGPAVTMNPDALADVACVNIRGINALPHHNQDATFTSRGCVRKCAFCAVPKTEGDLVELAHWEPRPVVCDNNFLACSLTHFDKVIDALKPLHGVDFNQGLDARLFTPYHADRLAELDLYAARLAWDNSRYESDFVKAFETLRRAGIPARKIRVYVLIGFDDTPDDALYRLETVRKLGAWPNPMRYQPLGSIRKNAYIHPNWTQAQLANIMRYYSRLRYFDGVISFDEYKQRRW